MSTISHCSCAGAVADQYCVPTAIGKRLSNDCKQVCQIPMLRRCLIADGYLPKQRPPLLAAYDLGQLDVVRARREARHIYSPPNDDDYSAVS
jgi:hypothetical protein